MISEIQRSFTSLPHLPSKQNKLTLNNKKCIKHMYYIYTVYIPAPSNRRCFFTPCWRWLASATSGREGGELHLNIPDQPQMCSIRAYPEYFFADSLQLNKSIK